MISAGNFNRKLREHLDAQRLAYVQIGRIEKMVTLAHALIGRNPDDNELERLKVQSDAANDKVKAEEEAERERGIDFARAVNEILTAKVRELDSLQDALPADVIQRCTKHLANIGVTRRETSSYFRAAKEGWAPSPTNDVQRKIWAQVHSVPSKPITIKP